MARCALFTAAMAVCGWLSVPLGDIAVSLQTFGLFLTLGLLGGRMGFAVCLVYLSLGVVGVPVFTGFQAGLGVLLGPAGGYLWGFTAAALVYWVCEDRLPQWLGMILGMTACYLCGTAWYYFTYADSGLWAVVLKCVIPYIVPDALKITLALTLAPNLKYKLIRYRV